MDLEMADVGRSTHLFSQNEEGRAQMTDAPGSKAMYSIAY